MPNPDSMVMKMISDEKIWDAAEEYMQIVLRQKMEEEKEYDNKE